MSALVRPPDPGGSSASGGIVGGQLTTPPPPAGVWVSGGKSFASVNKAQNKAQNECVFPAIQLAARQYGTKENKPSISFTASKIQVGLDHLKHALVAKFTGGRPPIQELRQSFLTTWKPSGHCSIGALDAKHILIGLETETDARNVLSHPMRKVGHSLFRIFRWAHDFSTKREPTSTTSWVRLLNLPPGLTNPGYIEAIVSSFGTFLAVDNRTRRLTNPNYARVCMELDTLKEHPDEVWISTGVDAGFWQKIVYENRLDYCVKCKLHGHSINICRKAKRRQEEEQRLWEGRDDYGLPIIKPDGPASQTKSSDVRSLSKTNGMVPDNLKGTGGELGKKGKEQENIVQCGKTHTPQPTDEPQTCNSKGPTIPASKGACKDNTDGIPCLLAQTSNAAQIQTTSKDGPEIEQLSNPPAAQEGTLVGTGTKATHLLTNPIDDTNLPGSVCDPTRMLGENNVSPCIVNSTISDNNEVSVQVDGTDNITTSTSEHELGKLSDPSFHASGEDDPGEKDLGTDISGIPTKPVQLMRHDPEPLDDEPMSKYLLRSCNTKALQSKQGSKRKSKNSKRKSKGPLDGPSISQTPQEPKAHHMAIESQARSIGFHFFTHGAPINNHIWLFWNDCVNITNISWQERFVTCRVMEVENNKVSTWTYVYGISYGTPFATTIRETLVLGSFLEISTVKGGLSDLGFVGNPFTWSNNQSDDKCVWERLDRVLCNGVASIQYPQAKVTHLARTSSDHCPLLFTSKDPEPRRSRFFYQKMWHSHPGFSKLVEESWSGSRHANPLINFFLKLKHLRTVLKRWNWDVYGNIHRKQRALTLHIAVLEADLQSRWDENTSRELAQLKADLHDVQSAQLDLAQSKAKLSWLLKGDRNTDLFHAALRNRPRHTKVSIDLGDNNFTSDRDFIGQAAADHFKSLFQGHCPPPGDDHFTLFQHCISRQENQDLTKVPQLQEVLDEIKMMNPDSSPGPDGYTGHFYTQNWDIIKDDLLEAIRGFFMGLYMPKNMSSTYLTLLPKVPIVTSISQLRPISLSQGKIAGWSRNFLSMAGRVVLVNAVLSTISMHVVASLPVPKATLSRIQSIMANFIWDSGGSKMRHWLSWDKWCRDKGAGGLGVRSLSDVQLAFRGKLAWNFLYSESLWAKFMRGKYQIGSKGSVFWNSFNHLIPTIEAQCKWSLGKGTISAATWCKPLGISVPSSIEDYPMHRILNDAPLKNTLRSHMPIMLANHLDDIVLSRAPDRIIWMGSPTGVFTIKAFQNTYRTTAPLLHWTKFIWASWMPPKVAMFIWRLTMRAISTDARISKLGIPLASQCVCCNTHSESDRHLFFQGPWAIELSSLLSDYFGTHRPASLPEFLRLLPKTNCKDFRSCFYLGLFCCGLWEIWISRNKLKHNERHVPLRVSLRRWAENLKHCIPYPNLSVPGISSLNILLARKTGSWRLWKPGWNGVTLNISIQVNETTVHGGAILRSNRGAFIGAFGKSFERSSSFRELISFTKESFIHLRVSKWSVCHVQSSHPLSTLLDPSQELQRPWDSTFIYRQLLTLTNGLTALRICPGSNNPALVLAYSPFVGSTFDKNHLPCGVLRALWSDSFGHSSPEEELYYTKYSILLVRSQPDKSVASNSS
ncbi:hypothetical protein QQ045_010076 [Rhodiola kirilowii]